jgi:pimeloyl-ACP methyl ester carboxylesterase
MAVSYAKQHLQQISGLVLWGSYPNTPDDLSKTSIKVVSIYGTRDGLSTPAVIDAARHLLPVDTRYVAIEGGNHGQFGWYGAQAGDNPAMIDRAAQQSQIAAATEQLLSELE